eukprot:sb/3467388/
MKAQPAGFLSSRTRTTLPITSINPPWRSVKRASSQQQQRQRQQLLLSLLPPLPQQPHQSSSRSVKFPPVQGIIAGYHGNIASLTGGNRTVIDLKEYLVIQDTPLSATNENYIQIGKTSTDGEKILLIYFDMKQAMEDAGLSTNIAVTDSKMNLRLVADDDGNDDAFNPGHLTMYPLKKDFNNESTWDYPWILEEQGPIAGVDYYSTVYSQFSKMSTKPETGKWLQSTITTMVRYIFTSTNYARDDHGFLFRYVTEDGSDPTHFLTFDSPDFTDSEFHPWMDICYVKAEEPAPCEDGQV